MKELRFDILCLEVHLLRSALAGLRDVILDAPISWQAQHCDIEAISVQRSGILAQYSCFFCCNRWMSPFRSPRASCLKPSTIQAPFPPPFYYKRIQMSEPDTSVLPHSVNPSSSKAVRAGRNCEGSRLEDCPLRIAACKS